MQWLDAVYQFAVVQYPDEFEFNEQLLLDLADIVLTNRYGTFLGECERERNALEDKTVSVWTDLLRKRDRYVNNRFRSSGVVNVPAATAGGLVATQVQVKFLPIKFAQIHLKLWERFWFKYHPHGAQVPGMFTN